MAPLLNVLQNGVVTLTSFQSCRIKGIREKPHNEDTTYKEKKNNYDRSQIVFLFIF